jgi:hypothetical protein
MTSPASSRSKTFALGCEIDEQALQRVNHQLLRLGKEEARNAMRRGLTKWSKFTKKTLEATAPFGKRGATEKVRGQVRPNVHLKWAVITKTKGYAQGLVTWLGVGVKRIDGSYLTPHWYLGWLEAGHAIKRKTTNAERILLKQRGERGRGLNFTTVGRSAPRNWIKKYRGILSAAAPSYVEPEVEKAIKEAGLG